MELVWKLLRQHISIPQFAGFAFAAHRSFRLSVLQGCAACLHPARQFYEGRLPHHE